MDLHWGNTHTNTHTLTGRWAGSIKGASFPLSREVLSSLTHASNTLNLFSQGKETTFSLLTTWQMKDCYHFMRCFFYIVTHFFFSSSKPDLNSNTEAETAVCFKLKMTWCIQVVSNVPVCGCITFSWFIFNHTKKKLLSSVSVLLTAEW